MQYVRLGACGLSVSRLGLGAMGYGDKSWREWVLDEKASRAITRRALERGINFFDTCDYYSSGTSEEILGRTLLSYVPRAEIVLASKAGMPMGAGPNARGFSRKHLFDAIDASLERLRTEYLDLYQTHIWDPSTHIEEMVEAFADLVRSGKTRYVGATDMPAWQLAKAVYTARHRGLAAFVSMQNHYNLLFREHERELMPLCRAEGIGLIPYSPMGRGFLCGSRRRRGWGTTTRAKTDDFAQKLYFRKADFVVASRVQEVAGQLGRSPAQVALAWVLARPGISAPLFGATRVEHVDEAVDALSLELGAEHCAYLESAYEAR